MLQRIFILRRFALAFLITFASMLSGSAQGLLGDWEGMIKTDAFNLPFNIHLQREAKGYKLLMDSPAQGVKGVPADSLVVRGDSCLYFSHKPWGLSYEGCLKPSGLIEGKFRQAYLDIPLHFSRSAGSIRQDERITERELFVHNDTLKIGATLAEHRDLSARRKLLALIVPGSGEIGRDGDMPGLKYGFYKALSDSLVLRGYSVLRYDKRGAGKTAGNISKTTHREFATDVQCLVKEMRRQRPGYKIILVGHSEGGPISAIALGELKAKADALCLLAAPVLPLAEIAERQRRDIFMQQADEMMKMINSDMLRETNEARVELDSIMSSRIAASEKFLDSLMAGESDETKKFMESLRSPKTDTGADSSSLTKFFDQAKAELLKAEEEMKAIRVTATKVLNDMMSYNNVAWTYFLDERLTTEQLKAKIDAYYRDKPFKFETADTLATVRTVVPKDFIEDNIKAIHSEMLKAAESRYLVSLTRLRPLELYKRLNLPIFAIQAEQDIQVTPDNLDLLRQELPKVQAVLLPRVNHLLQESDKPELKHYFTNKPGIAPSVVVAIDQFFAKLR